MNSVPHQVLPVPGGREPAGYWRRAATALAALALAALLAGVLALAAAPSRQKIYFYNPESNINNFSSLKAEFDGYLAGLGDFEFQPFSSRATFEQFLASEQSAIFLLSGWHFQQLRAQHAIRPVLVGSFEGKSMQRRVLYAQKAIPNLAALRGQKIASAGTREFTQHLLGQVFEQQKVSGVAESLRVIPVPKDIDALMAVALGIASAAITTERSIEQLRTLNPKQFDALHRLGESEEMLRVIVAVKDAGGEPAALLKAVEQMTAAPKGEYALQMIGLNGWQRYDSRPRGRGQP